MNLPPEHKLLLISWQQQFVKRIPVKTVRCPAGSSSARERDIGFINVIPYLISTLLPYLTNAYTLKNAT
jgi:hypothetical protein